MNKREILEFLKKNQPMPPDEQLANNPKLIDEYIEIIKYLETDPFDEAIPLLLKSFGKGDGLGTYTTVDNVLFSANEEIVLENLCKFLNSEHIKLETRYWLTIFAYDFLNEKEKLNLSLNEALKYSKFIVDRCNESLDEETKELSQRILDFITQQGNGNNGSE